MHPPPRPSLTARAVLARLFLGGAWTLALACGAAPDPEEDDPSFDGSGGLSMESGGASAGGSTMAGGGTSPAGGAEGGLDLTIGGSAPSFPEPCSVPDEAFDIFSDQAVYFPQPFGRVLYSWTSAEQEQELRAGGPLLSVGEVPLLGKGIAMDKLSAWAESPDAPSLDKAVANIFRTFRYAWPRPWATRIAPPGEDYGDRLVRMELAPQSWIGRLDPQRGSITQVVDLFGEEVALEEASKTPERIAALYYEHVATGTADAPDCYVGTFSNFGGSGGYREFIVGNPDLVEEWSLGTEEILERLQVDIQLLKNYMTSIRPCPPQAPTNFNATVCCLWGAHRDSYLESLALPSELYVPNARNLANLIDTMESELFDPDPFVARSSGLSSPDEEGLERR